MLANDPQNLPAPLLDDSCRHALYGREILGGAGLIAGNFRERLVRQDAERRDLQLL